MEKTKWNNFWFGAIAGLLLPCISLVLFWLVSYHRVDFYPQFFNFLLMGRVLSSVISLCLLPSLGVFYIFVNKEYYQTTRGIIFSTILVGAFIIYLKTYVEHSWSI